MAEDDAQWVRGLPRSRMDYPTTWVGKIWYWLWWLYTPLHPHLRDWATALGIIRHTERQAYLVGVLHPERRPQELAEYLVAQGFGNHFIAWRDPGELVSLRKTDGCRYQYHVRIFSDGEIRCHYEYTPEYRPIHHIAQVGFEDRMHEFTALLQDWVVPAADKLQ